MKTEETRGAADEFVALARETIERIQRERPALGNLEAAVYAARYGHSMSACLTAAGFMHGDELAAAS